MLFQTGWPPALRAPPGQDRRIVAPGHHIYYYKILHVVTNYETFVPYLAIFLVLSLYVLLKLFNHPDVSFQEFGQVSMKWFVSIPDFVAYSSMASHSSSTIVTLFKMQMIFLSLTKS